MGLRKMVGIRWLWTEQKIKYTLWWSKKKWALVIWGFQILQACYLHGNFALYSFTYGEFKNAHFKALEKNLQAFLKQKKWHFWKSFSLVLRIWKKRPRSKWHKIIISIKHCCRTRKYKSFIPGSCVLRVIEHVELGLKM